MYRIATRAKSRDSCVRVKEAVAAAEGAGESAVVASTEAVEEAGLAVVGVGEVSGVVVGGTDESNMMVGLAEADVSKEVEVKVTSLLTRTALAVGVGLELSLALAGDEAEPTGQSMPSKVTRAFSASHDRFAELKRARMMSEERGMLKFV